LYVREDQLIEQARTQLASHTGTEPDDINPTTLAARLRDQGITIVCTAVSITLDTGLDNPEPEPDDAGSASDQGNHGNQTGQLPIPGLVVPRPRQATKDPHQSRPLNVNDFGGG
jgi:hypothetical protein